MFFFVSPAPSADGPSAAPVAVVQLLWPQRLSAQLDHHRVHQQGGHRQQQQQVGKTEVAILKFHSYC